MTTITFFEYLQAIKASQEILDWVRGTKDAGDASDIYNSCVRGDWLLEIAALAEVDRRTIVLAACQCARTALQYIPVGEERPRKAIEAAEKWCEGKGTLEEVRTARAAAGAAWAAARAESVGAAGVAPASALKAARAAAWAAMAAARAAGDAGAARAAAGAAWAAWAAWDAAGTARAAGEAAGDAGAAARAASLKQSAAIVREFIPWDVLEEGLLTVDIG